MPPISLRKRLGAAAALRLAVALTVLATGLAVAGPAAANPAQWVQSFWPTAKAAGVSRRTYDAALGRFVPDPDVLRKAATQAEFNTPIWAYMEMMVSDERLSEGRAMLARHGPLLAAIEARYDVDRHVVVAIWGMESHYGAVLTNPRLVKNTIRSLATLAYSGGRLSKFGRQQLVAALKIVERGDVGADAMSGSWAGAMGHTQFIPTTFEAYAVDFDGDGHRNVWTSPVDALASTANYLRASGWERGRTWGYEVVLPAGVGTGTSARTLAAWAKLGVRRVGGQPFPQPGDSASLYLPADRKGPAFLVVKNFRVIKRYNNANAYALAVGHLADRLRGGGPFVTDWPPHEKPLSQGEREKLQLLLTMLGHYDGEIDGDIGSGSREAIRQYQRSVGVAVDGVESRGLLRRLESR
jgi:membrane-bound lytic murein transglycosylase B